MKTRLFLASFLGMLAFSVTASWAGVATWYVRGDFNGWGTTDPMTNLGGGTYSATVTGLTPGNLYEYKVAVEDWSVSAPGSNGRIMADSGGEATFFFHEGSFSDGWEPTFNRVGYRNPGHGWEVIGGFPGSDWTTGFGMTNMGDDVFQTVISMPAGSYEFKFRMAGSWDISIGDDFGNAAMNINFTATGDPMVFTLDLPGGRWNVAPVPEPASLGLLGLGGLTLLRRRR